MEELLFAAELILSVCLTSDADICADRLVPSPAKLSQEHCEATAQHRAAQWLDLHPGLTLQATRCASIDTIAPVSVVEVADGLWVHKGVSEEVTSANLGDIANIGFVIGDEAVAVIDAGGSRPVAEGLYAAVRQRTDLPIRHLILTHMHPDHSLGAEVFAEAGAEVIGNAHLADALQRRAGTYTASFIRLIGPRDTIGIKVIQPDRGVADRDVIDLGDRALTLQSWPTAHTNNDLTVLDEKTQTLFAGDLVFLELTPVVDGRLLGWLEVLEELRAIPATRLIPGHGTVPQPWPEGADPVTDYLTALRDQTRAAVKSGLSLSEAIARIGQDQRGDWQNFDINNPRNATVSYTELEWE